MKTQRLINKRDQINKAVDELGLSEGDFKLVRLSKYEQIIVAVIEKFTNLKKTQINVWWWEYFNEPRYSIHPKDAFETLRRLIDKDESVWFVVEDNTKEKEHFWLYEGKINAIVSILKELHFFEYYVVSKKLEWIICENHHNYLIASGEKIVEKLKPENNKQLQRSRNA